MEIIKDKALLLKLKDPNRVTTVIPKSKQVGPNEVLVKWGLEEAQVLKNLKVKNVPSPILRDYEWGGLHKPFDHQKATASFMTLHRRAFCFNEQGCVDSETEYLSPTGWVKLSEYKGGKVAQFHPETGTAEFVDPLEYVKLPCAEMVEFKSKYGIDQLLSPEHRVLHYKTDRNSTDSELFWRVDSAQSLHDKLVNRDISDVFFKTTYSLQEGAGLALTNAQLRLQIAVIADGYFGSNSHRCVVRVKKMRKVLRLRQLLDEAGVEYSEITPEYQSAKGFHVFTFYAPMRTKVFGSEFWQATNTQLKIVTEEVPHWDGAFRKSEGVAFYSTDKQSVDFVQHAFVSQGKVARVTDDGRGCWQVYVRNNARLVGVSNRHNTPNVKMVPSTDGYKYCFMVPSTFLLFRRNGCVFASGNTGKTASVIWAADYLMKLGVIRRVLVLCPLSIMQSAWQDDLFTFAVHRTSAVAHSHSREKRKKVVESDAEFVICNYDGLAIIKDAVKENAFDLIVIDEGNAYKTSTTTRWKTLNSILRPDMWVWMLTGTPASQSPEDAYGLAKIINPSSVPKFFGSFRDMVMTKITNFKWVPKPDAEKVVHNVLQPAIRFTKEECLDLPDITYTNREVPLTKQQTKYYETIRKNMIAQAAGEEITTVNAAANLNKLLQLSCGAVYSDTGDVIAFDASNRLAELQEVIEEASHKVLVFAPFRHAIEIIHEYLTKQGITAEIINGAVPANRRTGIFQRFQQETDPKVLVIQPQAAAHGVTLTAANLIVWFGPITSVETYLQANARVHRAGQRNPCTVVQLQGSPVEKRMYKMLESKVDIHNKVIDLYKNVLEDSA